MLFTPKRFTKLIAVFLTFLMLIGNPAVIATANAADSANSTLANELPVLTVEKSAVNANQIVLNPDSSRLSTDQKTEQFLNQLIPYYLQNGKQHGPALTFLLQKIISRYFHWKPSSPFLKPRKTMLFCFGRAVIPIRAVPMRPLTWGLAGVNLRKIKPVLSA